MILTITTSTEYIYRGEGDTLQDALDSVSNEAIVGDIMRIFYEKMEQNGLIKFNPEIEEDEIQPGYVEKYDSVLDDAIWSYCDRNNCTYSVEDN